MHISIAKELITEQFEEAKDLKIQEINSSGSDNFIFLLGNDQTARFPKTEAAEQQLKKELLWLPVISKAVSVAIPEPLFRGNPVSNYPFNWAVFNWIEGHIYDPYLYKDADKIVNAMTDFIHSLWKIDIAKGPIPGKQNNFRGQPLPERDLETKKAIENMPPAYNKAILRCIWEKAVLAQTWNKAPVWVHGDLHWGNIITKKGTINGIIDFGTSGIGDPTVDVMCAWILFSPEKRTLFKQKLHIDEGTWIRAMGWALSFAVIALPYYLPQKHLLANIAAFTLDNLMADFSDIAC